MLGDFSARWLGVPAGRWALGVLGAASLVACASLIGLDDATSTTDSRPVLPPPPPVDPCTHAAPPQADPDAGSGESLPLLTAALRQAFIASANPADTPAGYDLDGVCTCNDTLTPGVKGAPSCVGSAAACDVPGTGVDNAMQSFFGSIGANVNEVIPIQCTLETGQGTVFYGLSNYNGERSDSQVIFSHFNAVPIVASDASRGRPYSVEDDACAARRRGLLGPDAGTALDAGAGDGGTAIAGKCGQFTSGPAWQGCDRWAIQANTQTVIRTAGTLDVPQVGYVRDGHLVVPSLVAQDLHIGDFALTLRDGFFTADIELVDDAGRALAFGSAEVKSAIRAAAGLGSPEEKMRASTVRLRLVNGVFTGRVDPAEVFRSVAVAAASLSKDTQGLRLCQSAAGRQFLQPIRGLLCSTRDLAGEHAMDNKGLPCTTSSFAMRFSAVPAYPGDPAEAWPSTTASCDLVVSSDAGASGDAAPDGARDAAPDAAPDATTPPGAPFEWLHCGDAGL